MLCPLLVWQEQWSNPLVYNRALLPEPYSLTYFISPPNAYTMKAGLCHVMILALAGSDVLTTLNSSPFHFNDQLTRYHSSQIAKNQVLSYKGHAARAIVWPLDKSNTVKAVRTPYQEETLREDKELIIRISFHIILSLDGPSLARLPPAIFVMPSSFMHNIFTGILGWHYLLLLNALTSSALDPQVHFQGRN